MAFEVAQSKLAPENTTVENYSVSRLTGVQSMRTRMTETRRGWIPLDVLRAEDANSDGVFEVLDLRIIDPSYISDVAALVGRTLLTEQSATVGVVATAVLVPVASEAPGVPAFWRVTLASGGLASAAPATLQTAHINFFGVQVNNIADGGRSWELELQSSVPEQAARMQAMMFRIQVALLTKGLAALGITKTAAEIQAAAMAMLGAGDSVDSIIATEMEQLEKDRRAGVLTSFTVVGLAPVVA